MAARDDQEAAEIRQRKKQNEAIRNREAQKELAVRGLYATREGRVYLRWLLEVSKAIGQQPFRGEAPKTDFTCGEMNVGIRIMTHLMETDPDAFAQLLKEQADEYYAAKLRRTGDQRDLFDPDAAGEGDSDGGYDQGNGVSDSYL